MGCDRCDPDECSYWPTCDRYNKAEQSPAELEELPTYPNCMVCLHGSNEGVGGCARHRKFKISTTTFCKIHFESDEYG